MEGLPWWWLRIRLPMQGTRVRALVQEDPTCRRATKPVYHNYWACTLEPASHNYWAYMPQLLESTHSRAHVPQPLSPCAATTEACVTRAHAPQQEKPPQWETTMKSSPHSPQLSKESPLATTKTQHSQKKKKKALETCPKDTKDSSKRCNWSSLGWFECQRNHNIRLYPIH